MLFVVHPAICPSNTSTMSGCEVPDMYNSLVIHFEESTAAPNVVNH